MPKRLYLVSNPHAKEGEKPFLTDSYGTPIVCEDKEEVEKLLNLLQLDPEVFEAYPLMRLNPSVKRRATIAWNNRATHP